MDWTQEYFEDLSRILLTPYCKNIELIKTFDPNIKTFGISIEDGSMLAALEGISRQLSRLMNLQTKLPDTIYLRQELTFDHRDINEEMRTKLMVLDFTTKNLLNVDMTMAERRLRFPPRDIIAVTWRFGWPGIICTGLNKIEGMPLERYKCFEKKLAKS